MREFVWVHDPNGQQILRTVQWKRSHRSITAVRIFLKLRVKEYLGSTEFKVLTLHVSVMAVDLEMTRICWAMPQFKSLSRAVKVMSCLSQIRGNNDKVKHFQLFFLNCHLYSPTFPLFVSYHTVYLSLVS